MMRFTSMMAAILMTNRFSLSLDFLRAMHSGEHSSRDGESHWIGSA
ncbi:MAG TPA: hypothetical protein VHX37_03485 [Acidobacteriaceae bacterium]|jgi:hypothetical protein|nr:hypothetical protein [Acidobacteriaceae bacterium]